jgi:hypothetical protein
MTETNPPIAVRKSTFKNVFLEADRRSLMALIRVKQGKEDKNAYL